MTVDTASDVRRQAVALSSDVKEVVGPLEGYHHEAYAFPLSPDHPLARRFARAKLRVPRPGVLWFDRRCFTSEDLLLTALQGRITRIPETAMVSKEIILQGFIEGEPLGRSLTCRQLGQLGQLFQEMAAVEVADLSRVPRSCGHSKAARNTSVVFLNRLIDFTAREVYGRNAATYGGLFRRLDVHVEALKALKRRSGQLRDRTFTLIHGDLHRRNFVVDADGQLWTIDWELAMIGDPLYELATHLHLMRYASADEDRVIGAWQNAVGSERHEGWKEDLPHLLAYKRAQSVFTDVIRAAEVLRRSPEPDGQAIETAALDVHRALLAAQEVLRLPKARTLGYVTDVYADWLRFTP